LLRLLAKTSGGRILVLLMAMAAGALITLVIAFTLFLGVIEMTAGAEIPVGGATHLPPYMADLEPLLKLDRTSRQVLGFGVERSVGEWRSGRTWLSVARTEYGWPWRAVFREDVQVATWSSSENQPSEPWGPQMLSSLTDGTDRAGLRRGVDIGNQRRLPVAVMTGFYYNVALWTLLFLGSAVVLRRMREMQRARRGQCVECAYMLAGLGTCPECGTIVDGAADVERASCPT